MIGKCANPACPAYFDHRIGGKFYRFRRQEDATKDEEVGEMTPRNSHNVEHFWLCPRCCHVFTLVYIEGRGVLLRLLGKEVSADASREILTAA